VTSDKFFATVLSGSGFKSFPASSCKLQTSRPIHPYSNDVGACSFGKVFPDEFFRLGWTRFARPPSWRRFQKRQGNELIPLPFIPLPGIRSRYAAKTMPSSILNLPSSLVAAGPRWVHLCPSVVESYLEFGF
jgi:hypothetical protein